MVKRYAVIDAAGRCVNVILWDGVTPWAPPSGCTVAQSDTAQIHEDFAPKTPIDPVKELVEKVGEIDALKLRIDELEKPKP